MVRVTLCLLAVVLPVLPGMADVRCGQPLRYLEELDPDPAGRDVCAPPRVPHEISGGQWGAIGPEGGYVRSLVMHPTDPSVMYTFLYTYPARLFKTTDRGTSWELVTTLNDNVVSLAIDPVSPAILYAGTYGDVHKSTDSGLSWSMFSTQTSGYVYDLAVDPVTPSTLWGAGYHWNGSNSLMTVLKSTNAGQNWAATQLYTADNGYGYTVEIDPVDRDIVYVGGYYRAGTYVAGLFRTTDGGGSWTETSAGITDYPVNDIEIDPANHTTLYAGVWNGTYKSTDSGANWSNTSSGYYNYSLAIDPTSPATVYTGQWNQVRKTTNGGGTWNSTGSGLFGYYMGAVLIDPVVSSRLHAGNYTGFFRTDNGGTSWSPAVSGLLGTEVTDVVVTEGVPSVVYAAVANDAVYKATVGRTTWTRLGEFVDCDEVEKLALDPHDGTAIYALTGG